MTDTLWRNRRLGVLGGGNMAEALVRGLLAAGLVPAAAISVHDPLPERLAVFRDLGCAGVDVATTLGDNDVVLLATKPQILPKALAGLAPALRPDTLLLSIAAGVATARIESALPAGARVIRVMPNTPLLVGMGMSSLCRGRAATDGDMRLALALFGCCGTAVEVGETHMDAVTALSGSGPAYLFRFAEALMAGGASIGLPPELAKTLTIATLRGAAEMLVRYEDAAALRERITSPGGTTAAALAVFDDADLMGTTANALAAARRRGEELGAV